MLLALIMLTYKNVHKTDIKVISHSVKIIVVDEGRIRNYTY